MEKDDDLFTFDSFINDVLSAKGNVPGAVDVNVIARKGDAKLRLEARLAIKEARKKRQQEYVMQRKRRLLLEQRKKKKKSEIRKGLGKTNVITRSMVPAIVDKPAPSTTERYFLSTTMKKNRCLTCSEMKDTECFYSPSKMLTPSMYLTTCISCLHEKHNNQSMSSAFGCMWQNLKRNANTRGIEFELTREQLEEIYERQQHRCNYTGWRIDPFTRRRWERKGEINQYVPWGRFNIHKASLDRIDPSKGYTIDNVHLVSLHINKAKLDLTDSHFVQMCADVVRTYSERKQPAQAPLAVPLSEFVLPTLRAAPGEDVPEQQPMADHSNKE